MPFILLEIINIFLFSFSQEKVKDEEDFNNSDENNLKPDEMYETIGSKVGSFR